MRSKFLMSLILVIFSGCYYRGKNRCLILESQSDLNRLEYSSYCGDTLLKKGQVPILYELKRETYSLHLAPSDSWFPQLFLAVETHNREQLEIRFMNLSEIDFEDISNYVPAQLRGRKYNYGVQPKGSAPKFKSGVIRLTVVRKDGSIVAKEELGYRFTTATQWVFDGP